MKFLRTGFHTVAKLTRGRGVCVREVGEMCGKGGRIGRTRSDHPVGAASVGGLLTWCKWLHVGHLLPRFRDQISAVRPLQKIPFKVGGRHDVLREDGLHVERAGVAVTAHAERGFKKQTRVV